MSRYTCRDLYFTMLGTYSTSAKAQEIKMRESRLEKYIKDYVYDKTAESVYLHLEDAIMISHITKRGSITLAILWANILQHADNFPPESCAYSKFFDSPTGGDRLILKADGVRFTIFMASGSIVMEGKYIYDWFSKNFRQLLDNYDQSFQRTWTFIPTQSIPVADEEPQIEKYIPETDTERYLSYMTTRHVENTPLDKRMAEHADDLIPGLGNMNLDQTLFEGEDLERESELLRCGAVKDGFTYVYKLWKSFLNKWLSDLDTKVYVANPQLDAARLQDIVDLNVRNLYKGTTEVIYTNLKCDRQNGKSIEDIKGLVLKKYDGTHRAYVDYRILNKIMLPMKKINARFIAGVKGDSVEVLVTSAGFHEQNFLFESMETVMYITLDKDAFLSQFIKPIETRVVASAY